MPLNPVSSSHLQEEVGPSSFPVAVFTFILQLSPIIAFGAARVPRRLHLNASVSCGCDFLHEEL